MWSLVRGYGSYRYVIGSRKQALKAFLDFFDIPKLPKDWYFEKVTEESLKRYQDPRVE